MSFRNKITALITSLSICAGMFCTNIASADEEIDYQREYETLVKLGVLDEREIINFNTEITRADVAQYIFELINRVSYASAQSNYIDVNASIAQYDAINTCYELGLMIGIGNMKFAPDRKVTLDEVLSILSRVSTDTIIPKNEITESQWRRIATELEITKGMSVNYASTVTNGDMIHMLRNMIDAQVYVTENPGSEELVEETILKHYYGIEKGRGIVTSNSFTHLTNTRKSMENEIDIDDITYNTNGYIYDELLGCSVEYYYSEKEETVYDIYERPNRNKVLILNEYDIKSVSNGHVDYYVGTKEKSAKFSTTSDVIWNGRYHDNAVFDNTFIPRDGSIKLLDNNSDGTYDCIFVNEYKNILVQHVDIKNSVIYADSKLSGEYSQVYVDKSGYETYIYGADGQPMSLNQIEGGSIASVEMSKNKSDDILVTVRISDTMLSGKVEKAESADRRIVTIDSKEYDFDYNFDYNEALFKSGTVYLDVYGKVAYFDNGEQDALYGYLTKQKM